MVVYSVMPTTRQVHQALLQAKGHVHPWVRSVSKDLVQLQKVRPNSLVFRTLGSTLTRGSVVLWVNKVFGGVFRVLGARPRLLWALAAVLRALFVVWWCPRKVSACIGLGVATACGWRVALVRALAQLHALCEEFRVI